MKRGLSAESSSAWRSLLMAVLSPCSNSTNVSAGHSACCNSSRVTISPAMPQQQGQNLKRLVLNRHLPPALAQLAAGEIGLEQAETDCVGGGRGGFHASTLTAVEYSTRCSDFKRATRVRNCFAVN